MMGRVPEHQILRMYVEAAFPGWEISMEVSVVDLQPWYAARHKASCLRMGGFTRVEDLIAALRVADATLDTP